MRKLLFLGLATLSIGCAGKAGQAKKPTTADQKTLVTLPRSTQFEMTSTEGLTYRVSIAEVSDKPNPERYAVLYVLDANAMFLTTVEAARFQRGLVPTLVVGIGYPTDATVDVQRRYWDFTPPTPIEHIRTSGTEGRTGPERTGGETDFTKFLLEKVRPEIARRYVVDDSRQAILGHSLAGRFVLHTAFTRPEAFGHYVAISPSIWWNDKSVVGEKDAFIRTRSQATAGKPAPVKLMVTSAEYERRPPVGTPPDRVAFFKTARMGDNARELVDSLSAAKLNGVEATYTEFAGENHGSVVPGAISRATRFALAAPPATRPASAPAK